MKSHTLRDLTHRHTVTPSHLQCTLFRYRGAEEITRLHSGETPYPALLDFLPNTSMCNTMLLLLYFQVPFRHALLSHLCDDKSCLTCQMGFVFHALDQMTVFPKVTDIRSYWLIYN